MNFPSRWPRWKSKDKIEKETEKTIKTPKWKILVISWWWARWAYALWIMKAMEECEIKKEIDAIYGVSIWAIVWAVWSNGTKAEEIFELLTSIWVTDFYWTDVLRKSWGFISNKKVKSLLHKYLPENFEDLKIQFYAWAVDTNSAEYKLFNEWNLPEIVLWSMSIPWIFPPVIYDKYSLVDWWVLNNFPVDLAKQDYPDHEIIWIALNKFKVNQKIVSAFDNLMITFEVMMRSKLLENTKLVDYLFYKELPIPILSLSKKQMQEAFALWYKDWIKMFKKKEQKGTN